MNVSQFVGYVVIALLLLAVYPLAMIWATNTLFGLSIAYSFKTWLAALCLSGLFSSARISKGQ